MRMALTVHLPFETAVKLRSTAERLKVSVGALVDLSVRGTLAKASPEALEKWASGQRKTPAPELKRSERHALIALTDEFRPMKDVRAASGLGVAVCWRALQGLEAKGLAESLIHADVVRDEKGRPLVSQWRRAQGKVSNG
jgi:hypothetical protein